MREFSIRASFRLRWFYVTRYSWLIGALLMALPVICLCGVPSLLANLFVLDSPIQLFNVSWITMLVAAMVLITYRISELNAPDRFDDYRRALKQYLTIRCSTREELEAHRRKWRYRWLALWMMWFPIPVAALVSTWLDPESVWDRVSGAVPMDQRVGIIGSIAVIAGAVVGLLLLRVAAFIERNVLAPNAVAKGLLPFEGEPWRLCSDPCVERRGSNLSRFLARLIAKLGPGYSVEPHDQMSHRAHADAQVALGHTQLALFTGLIVTFYLGNYLLGWVFGVIPDEGYPMSALYFLLLTILVIACMAPGAAFFLDRYRIPVLLAGAVTTFSMYMIWETDHYYALNPRGQNRELRTETYHPPEITDVFKNWEFPEGVDGKRTLVVVDASGGGIQASAWTAQVLTGLDAIYGSRFSRSIGVISAVSGGSVGTMYYVINRPEFNGRVPTNDRPSFHPDVARRICSLSQASALEATAWGTAYPDLMRAVCPPLTSRTIDRGWSVEQVWRQRMKFGSASQDDRSDLRLSDLGSRVVNNQLPIVVFNATLVETGQRLVMSPVLGREAGEEINSHDAQEFFTLYGPKSHLRVSTAVRLSATFPYVSPVCRPLAPPGFQLQEDSPLHWHAADGAYSDNEGVVTALDWINRLIDHYNDEDRVLERPFDRVLLIRIQPFPTNVTLTESSRGQGWVNAWFGPLKAIMRVRAASQMERGNFEVRLLSKATAAESAAMMEKLSSSERAASAEADKLEREQTQARSHVSDDLEMPFAERAEAAGVLNNTTMQLKSMREHADRVRRKRERFEEINVYSVRFVCQPPDNHPGPLSWKLTASQKQAIAAAWECVLAGAGENQPLESMDEFFDRLPVPHNMARRHPSGATQNR